jgi:hypothetical protein
MESEDGCVDEAETHDVQQRRKATPMTTIV